MSDSHLTPGAPALQREISPACRSSPDRGQENAAPVLERRLRHGAMAVGSLFIALFSSDIAAQAGPGRAEIRDVITLGEAQSAREVVARPGGGAWVLQRMGGPVLLLEENGVVSGGPHPDPGSNQAIEWFGTAGEGTWTVHRNGTAVVRGGEAHRDGAFELVPPQIGAGLRPIGPIARTPNGLWIYASSAPLDAMALAFPSEGERPRPPLLPPILFPPVPGLPIVTADAGGIVHDTLAVLTTEGRAFITYNEVSTPNEMRVWEQATGPQPFAHTPQWAVDPGGNWLAVVETHEASDSDEGPKLRVRWISNEGRVVRTSSIPVRGFSIPEGEVREAIDRIARTLGGGEGAVEAARSVLALPRWMPLADQALVCPLGWVWIRQASPLEARETAEWLVVDPRGEVAATLLVPGDLRISSVDQGRAWAIAEDAAHRSRVVLIRPMADTPGTPEGKE